ncbi:MAG TPA: class I SAM-dependent methyltransferase [Geminicoccaceae bacterium]|nr:class I SAM-dependent methyltransferase [Geminicoccaceae bacterium]
MEIREIKIRPDERAVDHTVLDYIRSYAQRRDGIAILEAGCGRRWPYDLSGLRYVLTGLDVNADALRIRQQEKKDLHRIVLGDLRTVHFERQCFDVIYSAFVLEHVPQAGLVLTNFLQWLKPGGLLILKFPDRDSVYGFITRVTPFWFHILYKRYLVGNPNAGKPGYGPFPTVHEEIIGRRAFHTFVRQNGLIMREEYGFGTLPGLQGLATKAFSGLSFGSLAADYYNLLYILEMPPASAPALAEARHASVADAPGADARIVRHHDG